MIDVVYFCLGMILSLIFNFTRNSDNDNNKEVLLKGENEELKKEIEYYKDLCKWHVEEKQKLKQEHYIK
jgi:hypothetical protein